jgi:FAD dependent oxidoreductase
MKKTPFLFVFALLFLTFSINAQKKYSTQILIIGGGTGGVAAGIQAARLGVTTLIAEPTTWLGGMLTAAGVSATDGNHQMPAGLWGEFRDSIYAHYGSLEAVNTGWVSNTHFEPHVGAAIFRNMAEKSGTNLWFNTTFLSAKKTKKGWSVTLLKDGKSVTIKCKILIDATDLGDVAAAVGAEFDLGMDDRNKTGEGIAPSQENDIIQDLTWVAIVKDYGKGNDHTIPKPDGYDAARYHCCCEHDCKGPRVLPCEQMLSYAKLPNEKYLLNWPRHGNDYYANFAILTEKERFLAEKEAKDQSLGYIYYLQTVLGYRNLGLPDDEFPTKDRLAFFPYHREGRRVRGLVQLNVNHILKPYQQTQALYRTGIAVGDYPIDHHHDMNKNAPEIDFPPVPSFNIPVGCLIPRGVDHFLVADKAISVTNIVNGSSRLQPVVFQIGQAAGIIAALSVLQKKSPKQLSVRKIQSVLLKNKGYLMPYMDVLPSNPNFEAIQKIGAMGILRGIGEPYQWANRTWFYPDSTMLAGDLVLGLKSVFPELVFPVFNKAKALDYNDLCALNGVFNNGKIDCKFAGNKTPFRAEIATILVEILGEKSWMEVDIEGLFLR